MKKKSSFYLLLLAGIFLALIPRVSPIQAATLNINVDVNNKQGALNHFWESAVGTDHQYMVIDGGRLGQRGSDLKQQLTRAKNEAGLKRIRGHHILGDDVGIYNEYDNGIPYYNWTNLDAIYDFLVSIDMDPVVNLTFMPGKLKVDDCNYSYYYNGAPSWSCPPKDWTKWHDLIFELVKHCSERYGASEVAGWYWEVWNEPDLAEYWNGSTSEIYQLYDEAATAVKAANPNTKVGGLGFYDPGSADGLMQHCHDNVIPLDFISYHDYGGSSFVGTHNSLLANMASYGYGSLPLLVTEWSENVNGEFGGTTELDDERADSFSPYVILDFLNNARALPQEAFAYWTVSDIFEEYEYGNAPFLGTFGMITRAGIAKPVFNSYKLMHMTGTTRLSLTGGTTSTVSGWASQSSDGKQIQILIYNQSDTNHTVNLTVNNLPSGTLRREYYLVDETHSNAYTAWENLGKPTNPTSAQWTQMETASQLAKPEDESQTVTGSLTRSFPASRKSVSLTVLTLGQSITPTPGQSVTPTPSFLKGDVNHDGQVNKNDDLLIFNNFNRTPASVANYYDAEEDNKINCVDFVWVIRNWTP